MKWFVTLKAKRGLLLTVENLSKRVLGSPKVHVRCGWLDDRLSDVSAVNSTVKELLVFHNFRKSMSY